MKFSPVLLTTLVVAGLASAFPTSDRHPHADLERLDRFLGLLPEDLRQEVQETLHQSVAAGERPQFSPDLRDQIRGHMVTLKEVHVERLNHFLAMLPSDLRQEVQTLLEQSAANREFPRASEELRNKIRDHFAARKHRMDKFMAMLPAELRQEVQILLEQSATPEEIRNKIRDYMIEPHREQLNLFLDFLPIDLRQELEAAFFNGQRPVISPELRQRIREYFWQLLPVELREQLTVVIRQAVDSGMLPVLGEELRAQLVKFLEMLRTPQLF